YKNYLYKKFIQPIFTINDTPHSIALGVALGVFVALTPTVGMQMLIILVLGTLIRANRIIGVLLVWISNPITLIPMYYGYYWLGGKILSVELWTFATFSSKIDAVMAVKEHSGYFGMIQKLFSDLGPSLFLGSLIIATVCSVPLYPWVLYALSRRRGPGGESSENSESTGADSAAAEAMTENSKTHQEGNVCASSLSASCCKKAEPVSKSDS
ncbi:MAG: DUF2062 domain-containing protein, partial [Planctomycetota bacterium]